MASFVPRGDKATARSRCGVMLSTTLLIGSADAADSSLLLRRLDRNALRSVTSPVENFTALDGTASAETKSLGTLTVGVARDREQRGDTSVSTPFCINVNPGSWDLSLIGEGYKRVTAAGVTRSGAADLIVQSGYLYKAAEKWTIEPILGLRWPTHGETGSGSGSERAALVTSFELRGWALSITGALRHAEQAEPGDSKYSNSIDVKLYREFNQKQSFFVVLSRDRTSGSPSSYSVTAEYDFPIGPWLGGAVSLGQGLSAGGRNRLVEFDLTYGF